MAKSFIDCGVCELRQISKESEAWCTECEEGLCSECIEHHYQLKTENHRTIPIKEYLKMPLEQQKISQFCDKHHEIYQTFCKTHDTLCCRTCITDSHSECKELAALDDIVVNVKKSAALVEAEMKLLEMSENFQKIIEIRKQNIKDLHVDRQNIEKKIIQNIQERNDHLDNLQYDHLDKLHYDHLDKLQDDQLDKLQYDQLDKLQDDHLDKLQSDHPDKLQDDQLDKLQYDHLDKLQNDHPDNLQYDHLEKLQDDKPDKLEDDQPDKLEDDQPDKLGDDYFDKLQYDQLDKLQENHSDKFEDDHLDKLEDDHPDKLEDDYFDKLQYDHLDKLQYDHLDKLQDDHVDKLQDDLLMDLYTREKEEVQQIHCTLLTLENHQKELKELQSLLVSVKQNATNRQTFLAIKQIEASVAQKAIVLQSFVKDDKVEYKSLAYININDVIDVAIERLQHDVQRIGEIIIETSHSTVIMMKHKNVEAQMSIRPSISTSSIDNIFITKYREINVDSNDVTGSLIISDARVAFSCGNENRILIYKADGRIDNEINLSRRSFYIAYIKDTILAVTSIHMMGSEPWGSCIYIVNIKSRSITGTIPLDTNIYGITYRNGKVIYCTDQGIKACDLSNNGTRDIVRMPLPIHTCVTTFKDKLYFTNNETNTVTCCSMDGDMIWEYEDERVLLGPSGISTDNDGNVYVVNLPLSNLIVISADGECCRELLRDDTVLWEPVSLYYEKNLNKIVVANRNEPAVVFNVSR